MKKQKLPSDTNKRAKRVVDIATQESQEPITKNEAAVALGRLGGKKGGKARAESLTAARRKEIAQKAAAARWGNKND